MQRFSVPALSALLAGALVGLAYFDRMDLYIQSVIMFMGDNGYFLGERQFAGKWLMYDNSLRVPFIVYDPNATDVAKRAEMMALNIDVAPTILDYAGVEVPGIMEGESLKEVVQASSWEQEMREFFLCEHLFDHGKIPKSEGIRTPRYKYFRYIDHPEREEFYDLEEDPLETENLVESRKHRKRVEEMRKRLEEMTAVGSGR